MSTGFFARSRFALAVAAVAALVTGCTSFTYPDPMSAPVPGGASAAETVREYFAAIEANDVNALSAVLDNVPTAGIAMPTTAPTNISISEEDVPNPRPAEPKYAVVEVTFDVGDTPVEWRASVRYAERGDEPARWRILNGLEVIEVPAELTLPTSATPTTDSEPAASPTSTATSSPGRNDTSITAAAPGLHTIEVTPSNPLLTAPAEPVTLAVMVGERQSDSTTGHDTTTPTGAAMHVLSLDDIMTTTTFSLADAANDKILAEYTAIAEKCSDWCTEDSYSFTHTPVTWAAKSPNSYYSKKGLVQFDVDAPAPTSLELFDENSSHWSDWYDENAYRSNNSDPVFVAVSPVTVSFGTAQCTQKTYGDAYECSEPRDIQDTSTLNDVVLIFDISSGEPVLFDAENNGT